MPERRAYQERTIDATFEAWRTHRRLCVVLPTGAGKTYLAERIIQRAQVRTIFAVHRIDLVRQTADRFRKAFGEVDVINAESSPRGLPIAVASIQTLIARGSRPPADLVVWDEFHHVPSDAFGAVAADYGSALHLGLTATPERSDGRPMGDVADHLIVGANYSELIAGGYLLPCIVFRPPLDQLGEGLAQDPVAAYQRHAPGSLCIVFSPSVKLAYEHAERFTAAGYHAECIEAGTKHRAAMLERFRSGETRVLVNVNVLTEGIDVPECETVILGKAFRHVSGYLQAVGRVLRPHGSMARALCIDLTGASHHHGLPTDDRLYSLDGTPIRRASDTPLHTCVECGATFPSVLRTCPVCGDERPCATPKPPRIYSVELQEVWAGENTPDDVKQRELERLKAVAGARGFGLAWVSEQYAKTFGERPALGVASDARRQEAERLVARCKEKGWSFYAVVKQYKQTFGEEPDLSWVPDEMKRAELAKLQATAAAKGFKAGWAAYRYKALFGSFPRRAA